jgi:integrase
VLTLYKRHLPTCSKTNRLDGFTKKNGCKCPIWVEGTHDGEYRRHSLKTNSLAEAERQIAKIQDGSHPKEQKRVTIKDALDAFVKDCESRNLNVSTRRKYHRLRERLLSFMAEERRTGIAEIDVDLCRRFRDGWKLGARTVSKELERLRAFFKFAVENDWITKNPAKAIKAPQVKTPPRIPFSEQEVQDIIAQSSDDKELAFLLVLRHAGLRIGDASMLKVSQFDGEMQKYGKRLWALQEKGFTVKICS